MTGRRSVDHEVARLVLVAVVVLTWIGVPALVVVVLTRDVAEEHLADEQGAWIPVRELTDESTTELGLILSWTRGPSVVAPAWDGVVEVLQVSPGAVLRSGDAVTVVGGVTRTAYAGERPLWRELQAGDRGPDVTVLNGFLAERGLRHASGDRFTVATAAGVRAFASGIRAGELETFDPAWLLHMSEPVMTVAAVGLEVGAPVPEAGAELVRGEPSLDSALVTTQDRAARVATTARAGADPAGAGPGDVGVVAVGDDARTVPEGARLRLAGVELDVTDDRGRLSRAGLETLVPIIDPLASAVQVTAVSPAEPGRWAVPAAAVFVTDEGRTAVVRERDGASAAVVVEVVGSGGLSATTVRGEIEVGDLVLLSPAAMQRSRS